MAIQRDGSIRWNRRLAIVLSLGLLAILFAVPPISAHAELSNPPVSSTPNAGADTVAPGPLNRVGGRSVDAVLVFVNDTAPWYSFRGHSPAVPLPADAALAWDWFSGDPAAPNITSPGAPLDAIGTTTQARAAFSREGYAIAVWDSESVYGTRICPGDSVSTNVTKSDIRFSIFDDATGTWTAPAVAAAAPADPTNPVDDLLFTRPAIAIDNNGNGLLAFAYWQIDPCVAGGGTRQIRYAVWSGASRSFSPNALLAASAVPPIADLDPLAVAFSSNLVAGDAITRQDGIVTWWDAVAPGDRICPSGPVSLLLFWPRYARWDGNGFVQIDNVPGQRPVAADHFESLDVRSGMAASSDQRGHIGVAFPVTTMTDPCTGAGFAREVWRAIWNATTNTWENGTRVDDGGSPALAYGADLPGDRGRVVYQVPVSPPGGGVDPSINRSLLNGTGIAQLGQVDAATGFSPTIVQLARDTALVVWADGRGSLRFWERVGGRPPLESTGEVGATGASPFLAARTGSPHIPLAEWTYLQYIAHDRIPGNVTATVLDRLEAAGSTNLVNIAILLDDSGNTSHATDFYVKRLARTPLQDLGELNMGNQTTLQEFLARTVARYPARGEYILSVDDHGRGWRGTCSDDHPTTGDWIEPAELRGALAAVNVSFQIGLFNGCLMGSVETAYQVEGFVRFMVASQESMPISVGSQGMRYDQLLGRLVANPLEVAADPLSFANSIVADYEAANVGLRDYTFASIRVEDLPALTTAITAFRNLVVPLVDPSDVNFTGVVRDRLQIARKNAQAIRADSGVRDLFHFFTLVRDDTSLPQTVRDSAQAVLDWEPLVVGAKWSEAGSKPNARGLNVWFEASRVMYNEGAAAYAATRFAESTSWQDVVRFLTPTGGVPTRGLRLTLQSPNPDLFLRARDVNGLEVGSYSSTETCGGFCNSQIPNAGCRKSGGSTTIFLPMWTTPVEWFVDGRLIAENATYSLSLQEVTTDPATGDTTVLFSRESTGSVAPQEAATGQFQPDYSAPSTTASLTGTAGQDQWWRSSVSVTFNVTEAGHGVRSTSYRVDGGSYSTYTTPFRVSGDGPHRLEYFSTDLVGNVEPVESTTIRIDTVAPKVDRGNSCSQAGDAGWCHGFVLVRLSASDTTSGVSGIEVSLDGSPFEPYVGPQLVAGDGSHTLVYFANDNAGNPSAPIALLVPVDGTSPTMNLNPVGLPGNAGWWRSNVTVTSRATDETSGIASQTIRIGTGPSMPYTGPFVIETDGDFMVEITATDAAGNRASLVIPVKIDKTPPSFSFLLLNRPGTPVTASTLSIEVRQAMDATSGLAGCAIALDGGASVALGTAGSYRLTGLEDGPHTVGASCSDNAGNVGSKSADFTVNTNLLSPEGPYGPLPLGGLVGAILAAAAVGVFLAWRRRRRALFALSHRRTPGKGGKRGF